jgi:hypothetical protein
MSPNAPRTTELLRHALAAQSGETITLGEFIDPLGERAFGFLLLALALPNFIPAPIGVGGVMGVLVVLVGLQMLIGLEQPWLPRTLRRRGHPRASVERFVTRITPMLRWLERLSRPRLERLARHPVHRVSGLVLVLLGAALALPIPFTNYPFGFLLLMFGVALIEGDGVLLTVTWALTLALIVALFGFGHAALDFLHRPH